MLHYRPHVRITPSILLGFFFFLGISVGFAQEKISKKEAKRLENQTKGSRYFIEGEKALVLGDLERSFFYLQKALEFSPDEPAIHYKIAEVLVRSEQAEKALPYANRAVETDPENKYYALLVAEIYTQLKQPLKAAEILDRLTSDSEKNQQYNLDLASIYLQAGEFDKALVVLDRAEEYYGVREPFTMQKQRIYLRKNDLAQALAEGEKLIDAYPGNPTYVLNQVEILYNNGRLDQALTLVEEEMEKFPNQPELRMAAYTLLKEKGQQGKAQVYLISAFANPDLDPEVKAKTFVSILSEMQTSQRDSLLDQMESLMLDLHPQEAMVLEAAGERKKRQGNMEEAVELYKRSLQSNPKNASLLEQVILNSFGENADFAKLETFTVMATDEFPEAAEFWFYDGVVKSARKKDSLAVNSLNKAIGLNQGRNSQLDQVAFGSLGNSLFNLGKKDSAFHYFDRALLLNPNDEQVLNNLAYFLSLEKKDLEKAVVMSGKVVERFPDNSTYLDTHAWVLFQMGNYQEALTFMEKAIANESDPSGVLLEHYGDILFHLGKVSEALSWWKKASESDEASELISKKISDRKYYE
ncbi:tetratricopeptide repeat protein [Algoriphagus sp. oki45]|uniref:tetratricopeptide repeat protein n=1 Tax=Algoriphagus sp. oki45 TaxID=3067294 RepID=UPI0027F446F3|nr:tetratricopeptide repeat protein [Algoriphagus sp. oki45]